MRVSVPTGFLSTAILDNAGRTIASLNPRGFYSTVVLDSAGRTIASVNALGYRSSTTFDAASQPISRIDPLNRTSTTVFDSLGRAYATQSPLGYRNTVSFDAAGRQISVQSANNAISTRVYDAASRVVAQVSPLGYRVTSVYNNANQLVGAQNALGYIQTASFDAAGRTIGSVNPLGYCWTSVYSAASQRIATIDPLANISTAVFSPNGSLIAQQDARGFLTSMILDGARQRICLIDVNGGRTTTIFESRGLVSATQDPLNAFTSFQFDQAGNTVLRTDARNWPTTYTIDALNRPIQTVYIDSTRVTNSFDAAGQQIVSADVTGITSYAWDLDGRKIGTVNPTGIALTNTLDSVGNRLVLADSYGRTTYSWDLQSRLLGIINPMNETTTIQWDALSREQHRVLGNGGTVSHTWDTAGRETLLQDISATGVGQAIFTNSYDPLSNRLTVIELDNTLCTFGFDSTSQLISEAHSGTYAYNRSYIWDPLGNRLQQFDSGVLTQRTFNAANELLVVTPASGPPTTQVFDANGNLTISTTGSAVTTNTWSAENRLLSQVSPTVNEQYQYSQDGMRKEKVNSSGTTIYTPDGPTILLETTPAGILQARNTNYPGNYGGLASQNRGGTSSFYGFDSQRSTRILVSVGGMITDSLSFRAFGEELQAGSGTVNPYWYIGQDGYYRDLPGIMNAGQRKLIAANGTWLNRDLIGFAGGDVNLYRYVGNNPVVRVDPSGLATIKLFINAFIDKAQDQVVNVNDFCGHSFGSPPGPWAHAPINNDDMEYFTGDHRTFFEPGTARVHASLSFDSCDLGKLSVGEISYNVHCDSSHSLFSNYLGCLYELTETAMPNKTISVAGQGNPCHQHAFSVIQFDFTAYNPLLLVSPGIYFQGRLTVSGRNANTVNVQLDGLHTRYPWFEGSFVTEDSGVVHIIQYSATPGDLMIGLITRVEYSVYLDNGLQAQTPPCTCPCTT